MRKGKNMSDVNEAPWAARVIVLEVWFRRVVAARWKPLCGFAMAMLLAAACVSCSGCGSQKEMAAGIKSVKEQYHAEIDYHKRLELALADDVIAARKEILNLKYQAAIAKHKDPATGKIINIESVLSLNDIRIEKIAEINAYKDTVRAKQTAAGKNSANADRIVDRAATLLEESSGQNAGEFLEEHKDEIVDLYKSATNATKKKAAPAKAGNAIDAVNPNP